jgi:hypothetical protein
VIVVSFLFWSKLLLVSIVAASAMRHSCRWFPATETRGSSSLFRTFRLSVAGLASPWKYSIQKKWCYTFRKCQIPQEFNFNFSPDLFILDAMQDAITFDLVVPFDIDKEHSPSSIYCTLPLLLVNHNNKLVQYAAYFSKGRGLSYFGIRNGPTSLEFQLGSTLGVSNYQAHFECATEHAPS